tara:strand:+ start:5876 stop:6202 length:327 start_codon:yes stop_codon:yes gene_type:complete
MKLAKLEHDGLDWDDGNTAKIEARVPVEVLEDFFKQELLVKEDQRHSFSEERFLAMGYTKEPKRCLFVAFTIRNKGSEKLIRPISARYTHKKEEEAYEAQIKKLQEND